MHEPIQILVISSLENQRALLDILNQQGWDTICASTLNECQEALAGKNVTLVFCDKRLLDGTYRDALRIIRSLNKDVQWSPLDWRTGMNILRCCSMARSI